MKKIYVIDFMGRAEFTIERWVKWRNTEVYKENGIDVMFFYKPVMNMVTS